MTTKEFKLKWSHQKKDPNILRPNNEMNRSSKQYYTKTLADRVAELKQHPQCAALIDKMKKNMVSFKSKGRRKFAWVPLSCIIIDEDIQREMDLTHALQILKEFDPNRISVIYAIKEPGKEIYHSTDGQHNSVIQALLFFEGFWSDLEEGEELLLPVMYIETDDKSFARDDFHWNNGKGKKPVEDYAMLRTSVFKYRIDGKRDKESVLAHQQVEAVENNNCYPVRSKDKNNSGRAGAITHIAGLTERSPEELGFITKCHDTYWTESAFDACEYGFYGSFYRDFIVDKKVNPSSKKFVKFMDDINAVIKSIFWTHANLKAQASMAWDRYYRAVHGITAKVPAPTDTMVAATVCRIYQKLGGKDPILDTTAITHTHDIIDFFDDEITKRIESYL